MAHRINCLKYENFYKGRGAEEVKTWMNQMFSSRDEIENAVNEENKDGIYPIHLATIYGNPDVLNLLLKEGADPNKRHRFKPYMTALHHAAKAENLSYEKVKILIEYGAELELKDREGWRAIHFASKYGTYKTLKLLIDKGADKESRTGSGSQPIELAKGNSRISKAKRNELFLTLPQNEK